MGCAMTRSERIRSRPYVWQPVSWSDQRVMTRGSVDGLPALTWGRADRAELATARQLRELGLRAAGAAPVAVLVFGHRQPGRRPVEHTSLYRIADAAPKRTATPAQREAIDKALAARRTCRDCGEEQDYYLPTASRSCGPCSDATAYWDDHNEQAAEHDHANADAVDDGEPDGWRAEHAAAMRADDPHRPVTDADVLTDDLAEREIHQPVTEVSPVVVPAQRRAEPDLPAPAAATASSGDEAPAAQTDPATRDDETARAVERAQHALTRIAQRRTATGPRVAEQDRAEWLTRCHTADQAADHDDQTDDRGAEAHRELEGSTR